MNIENNKIVFDFNELRQNSIEIALNPSKTYYFVMLFNGRFASVPINSIADPYCKIIQTELGKQVKILPPGEFMKVGLNYEINIGFQNYKTDVALR